MASTVEHDADSSVQHIEPASDAVEEEFHRGLKERHIQMIAIGGAIGVGLFLGSAKAIQQAGPVAAAVVCRRRGSDLLHHAGAGRVADVPAGLGLLRHLRR